MKVRCHECRQVVAGYESRDGNHRPLDHTCAAPVVGACHSCKTCGDGFEDADCPGSGTVGTLVPEMEGDR